MDTIQTIIVDDEPLARKRIRTFLSVEPDFAILAECENGEKAIQAIESMNPDLVFLDIQMPGIDGFEVLSNIERDALPMVVFVTAYDQYAVRAFEVRALDYLLKPFDEDRFKETLDRVRSRFALNRERGAGQGLLDLLEELRALSPGPDRLLVKSAGRISFLPMNRIDWIEAAGNYVHIHAGVEMHLMRKRMNDMEKTLSPTRFVRVHRSAIVNLEKVKELISSRKGEYEVVLLDGTKIPLGRKYRDVLESRLGKSL